ncbi:ATP-binding protein [Chitinasiproducens palmae]|uniref:ATP-binding protein n=1 Tax=Chitinasiproducens palmae TaxID=1770053 RepID=A0A1H2PKS4_9BURK|nr:hypothetical protein [Chitinasiproducens palmae]SDV46997.1 hypothetical protein SAMN05216551_102174 [Chitinasiproducens palmae]
MKLDETASSDPWHFARPSLAAAYLDAFDLKLSSARGLFARRRMGKTEFLQQDLLPAATERGYLIAYTNLWESRAAPDSAVVSALSEALAPHGMQAVLSALGRPVRKVKAGAKILGSVEGTFEAELGTEQSSLALREVLKQIDRQKKPLLLVIDEAQVLAHARNGDFAHALRAGLDIRKDRIKVIFAGSSETTLRTMFARASEPFYNWAALEPFPLLGVEFVDYTVRLMNSMARNRLKLEQGIHAFSELHSTPEFFKRFVERYMLYQVQGVDAALSHTKATVFSDDHFHKQWSARNPADQAVLILIARSDYGVHSGSGLSRLSEMLGRPASKSTVSHALRRLEKDNAVTRLGLGDYRIEDEAFADWIRRKAAAER